MPDQACRSEHAQVFVKVLGGPGFGEICVTLCSDLNKALPSFKDKAPPTEEDTPEQAITFRRVLLNKCQEEFEMDSAAMATVEARERKQQEERGSAQVRAHRGSVALAHVLLPN